MATIARGNSLELFVGDASSITFTPGSGGSIRFDCSSPRQDGRPTARTIYAAETIAIPAGSTVYAEAVDADATYIQSPVSGGMEDIWNTSRATAFFGDSLTNDIQANWLGAQEYSTHAVYASGGRMLFAGKFGQGGMGYFAVGSSGKTFEQAKAELLASTIKPKVVNVLLGTNDLAAPQSRSFVEVRDATVQFVLWLESNGFAVVLSHLPPRNDYAADAALRLKMHTYNVWVTRYCGITKRRLNAWYSALSSLSGDGMWRSGYNRDSVHWGAVGAKAAGLVCAKANSTAYEWEPYLPCDNSDLTGLPNPLFLTDAITSGASAQVAGDGIPDQWGKANIPPAGLHALSSAAGDGIHGNYWTMDTAGSGGLASATIRSNKITAAVGDVIQIAARVKVDPAPSGITLSIGAYHAAGTSWVTANGNSLVLVMNRPAGADAYAIDAVIYAEATVMQIGTLGVSVEIAPANVGGGGGIAKIAQMAVRNLTALGAHIA